MSRLFPARMSVVAGLATALLVVGTVPAMAGGPSADPATPPGPYTRVDVDKDVPGASFSTQGDLYADPRPELVVSSYGELVATPSGNKPAAAGRLQVYRIGSDLSQWTKQQVFDESAAIMFPNEVTIADVSGDGAPDLIVPGGYFFDTVEDVEGSPSNNRGSLTWWENKGTSQPWVRHNIEVTTPWAYHGVQFVDLDDDGVKDIVTSGEQGGYTAMQEDDVVKTRYFKGSIDPLTQARTFAPAVNLSDNGGSIPQVADIDGDGELDIVTAQFFGVDQPTYLWLERIGEPTDGVLSSANFVMHSMIPKSSRGSGFEMKLVPNLRGDGVDRWVGTNHLLYPYTSPDGGMFELIPGADVTQEWTSEVITGPISPRTRFGQGAPGVFGHGDADGDGDTDFALSGDGDHRVFWIEQKANGTFERHTLVDYVAPPEGTVETDPAKRGFGQAGGALIMDLDGDGKNEIEFSSFDENMVSIWTRTPLSTTTSKLTVTGGGATAIGASRTLALRLTGTTTTPARQARVTFKPNRTGVATTVATVNLAATATPGVFTGALKVTPKESGTYTATYAGTFVNPFKRDTAASGSTTVTSVSKLTGFPTKTLVIKKYKRKATAKKKAKLTYSVTVTPGFGRTVTLQKRTCAPSKSTCSWKTVSSKKVSSANKVTFTATAPKGTSYWRTVSAATKSGTAVTSPSRKVTRR